MKQMRLVFAIIMIFTISINTVMAQAVDSNLQSILTEEEIKHNEKIDEEKKIIQNIMNDIAEIDLQRDVISSTKSTLDVELKLNELDAKEESLENQLYTLGVKKLSEKEVQNYLENAVQKDGLKVTVPPTTSNTRWYDYEYTVYRTGTDYEIQELYAQARNTSSTLGKRVSNQVIESGRDIIIDETKTFFSVYVQKVLGLVPVIGWMPYEYGFQEDDELEDYESTVTSTVLSTVCFSYVKELGQSDDYQQLTFVTNMYNHYTQNIVQWIENGITDGDEKVSNGNVYSDYYASYSKAIERFNLSKKTSFCSHEKIYDYDEENSYTLFIPNATAPYYIQ